MNKYIINVNPHKLAESVLDTLDSVGGEFPATISQEWGFPARLIKGSELYGLVSIKLNITIRDTKYALSRGYYDICGILDADMENHYTNIADRSVIVETFYTDRDVVKAHIESILQELLYDFEKYADSIWNDDIYWSIPSDVLKANLFIAAMWLNEPEETRSKEMPHTNIPIILNRKGYEPINDDTLKVFFTATRGDNDHMVEMELKIVNIRQSPIIMGEPSAAITFMYKDSMDSITALLPKLSVSINTAIKQLMHIG